MPLTSLPDLIQRHLGDDFLIERELGGGGMSLVFVAHDKRLDRRVVVKLLRPELRAGLSVERFRREILTAASLQHPLIVPVLDTGEIDGTPFFLMPFVDGESLRTRLLRGRMDVVSTVRILRDVARALAVAHAKGVVHRDIKPDNVLLADDAAVVADFGVSKAFADAREGQPKAGAVTTVGVSLGTPAYMAPEQVAADPNAAFPIDLYAFGVLGYEMLVGEPPFVAGSPQQVMAAHIAVMPEPIQQRRPDVPAMLARLLMQCLQKDPSHRPASASALVTALDDPQVISGSFVPIVDDGTGAEAMRVLTGAARAAALPTSRRTWLTAALITVGVIGGVIATQQRRRSSAGTTAAVVAMPDTTPSVAVMPFAYLSADSSQAFTAHAIAAAITDALSREPGLRVASLSAATALQKRIVAGDTTRMPVRTLLEGAVEVEGDKVRLSIRLVSAEDGFTILADRVDGETGNLFAMEDELATSMRERLRNHFGLVSSDSIGTTLRAGDVPRAR